MGVTCSGCVCVPMCVCVGGLTSSAWLDWPGPVGIPLSLHNKTWIGLSAPSEILAAEISKNFYTPLLSETHTHTYTHSAHMHPTSLSIFLFCAVLLNACPYILEVLMQSLKLSCCSLNSTLFLCSTHKLAHTHNQLRNSVSYCIISSMGVKHWFIFLE